MNEAQREKRRVTLVSVAAAVVLTLLKLAVGVLTGSLGLLSEAAHSGLDLVASVLTFLSVRIAERPADANHPYGHGRVENLSATLQGLLLMATAAGIIYESVRRILFHDATVAFSVWTFVVMGGSIGVDYWRSRMLLDAARRHHSRALEADALNFRADMYSSAVVIVGLALTYFGPALGGDWLRKADAVAALVVALIILRISGGLAADAVQVLLDRSPGDLGERIGDAVVSVPGVLAAPTVRVRESGHRVFADVVVSTSRTTSLEEAHQISERIEESVRAVEPRAEALVHVEPVARESETAAERIRAAALRLGMETHHERVHDVAGRLEASLHLEVPEELTLEEAYAISERLVAAVREDNPALSRVDTHIEVATPDLVRWQPVSRPDAREAEILRVLAGAGVEAHCHEIHLHASAAGAWGAVLHCDFPPELRMGEIHARTERIEHALREHLPGLEYVLVHAEPATRLASRRRSP
jgi:cation diffusion facilitator family transporter